MLAILSGHVTLNARHAYSRIGQNLTVGVDFGVLLSKAPVQPLAHDAHDGGHNARYNSHRSPVDTSGMGNGGEQLTDLCVESELGSRDGNDRHPSIGEQVEVGGTDDVHGG